MTKSIDEGIAEFLQGLFVNNDDRQDAIDRMYMTLRDREWLSRVTLHRYMCARGCQIATVFRAAEMTLCAVRDYKYSPGLNMAQSVEAARVNNTLDGNRHWPSHVYDVEQVARFSGGANRAGISMVCRHFAGTVIADDILKTVQGVQPGHRGKPTRLGS